MASAGGGYAKSIGDFRGLVGGLVDVAVSVGDVCLILEASPEPASYSCRH